MRIVFLFLVLFLLSLTGKSQNEIIRIAGKKDGSTRNIGDGNLAITADFNNIDDITIDELGNIYISDAFEHRIRKIDTSGIISTVAGNGINGFSGDGIDATTANLSYPNGIFYRDGILYFADAGNHRIRKIDSEGIITTVAGIGEEGFDGDGSPALQAKLNNPCDVVLDDSGNMYIADTYNSRIRKVDTEGIISTFAGNGNHEYAGDSSQAVNASLYYPRRIILNENDEVIIADTENDLIRKIDNQGIIYTIAGKTSSSSDIGDDGPATEAVLRNPWGMDIDNNGQIFFADLSNNRIRRISNDQIITTIAGTGSAGYSGDGDSAVFAQLDNPKAICFDENQNLFLVDDNDYIRKIDSDGIISTIAGIGNNNYTGDGGLAEFARIYGTNSIIEDDTGNIYLSGVDIRKITPDGFIYNVFDLDFNTNGIAFDQSGNLIVADPENHRIRKITPDGTISIIAGNGAPEYNGDEIPAIQAAINSPEDVVVNKNGDIIFADRMNHRIRKIDNNGQISTIAGTGNRAYSGDGGAAVSAEIEEPTRLFIDDSGNLFFTGYFGDRIRVIDGDGIINTYTEDNASSFGFNRPEGLFLDAEGRLLICAGQNDDILLVDTDGDHWKIGEVELPNDVLVNKKGEIIIAAYSGIFKVLANVDISFSRNEVVVNPVDSINFGRRTLGSDSTITVSVHNSGLADLLFSEVSYELSGENADNFIVDLGKLPQQLGIGDTATFDVVFTPETYGAIEAVLNVQTSDPDQPQFQINLYGEVNVPEVSIQKPDGTSLNLKDTLEVGEILIGDQQGFDLIIKNIGEGLLLAEINLPVEDYFFATDSAGTVELNSGESDTVSIIINPDQVRAFNDILILKTNDPDEKEFSLRIIGSCVPVFELGSYPDQVTPDDPDPVISFRADWGNTPVSLSYAIRTVGQSNFSADVSIPYDPDTSSYSFTIPIENITVPGIEFIIKAEDGVFDIKEKSGSVFIKISSSGNEILTNSFGGTILDYSIISIPFKDPVPRNQVFEEIEPYDKKEWRLFSYNSSYRSFIESPVNLEIGKGYWFLQNTENTIRVPEKVVFSGDFELSLITGWNIIGNPFLGNLDWNKVLLANEQTDTDLLRNLIVYEKGYRETSSLKAFQGAVIFAEQNVNLLIPYSALSSLAARTSLELPNQIRNNKTIHKDWLCQVSLVNETERYSFLNGFGIHENAENEMDIFDIPILPFPGEFVSFNIEGFNRNIKRSGSFIKWDAILSNPGDRDYRLEFDVNLKGDPKTIIVYNRNSGDVTDLKNRKFLESTAGTNQNLSIYYGMEEEILREIGISIFSIGNPYPNPTHSKVNLPVYIGNMNENSLSLNISLIDLQGRILKSEKIMVSNRQDIYSINVDDLKSGLYQLLIEFGERRRVFKLQVIK